VRARQRPGSIVLDKLPERHPETLILVRPRCKHISGWDGQTPFSQESPDGDLASKPSLDVTVQHRCAGHHSRHNRSGFEMHKHITAGGHHNCFVAGDGIGESDGLGRRQGPRDTGFLSHVTHVLF
jgi:hypothetical protein